MGSVVTFESCDPGADAVDVEYKDDALTLPVIRNEIGIELVQSGVPPDVARCVAGRITDAYSVQDLSAADPARFQTDSFIQQVQGFVQECAPG